MNNTGAIIVGVAVCMAVSVAIYVTHSAWCLIGLIWIPHISCTMSLEGRHHDEENSKH
jgi:hypothetical protein